MKFCTARDYQIYESFPIIPKDGNLLFINASITPFKDLLTSNNDHRNVAIIQKCIRVGGGAYSLDEINKSNYCNTFFEMFGCVAFKQTHNEVVSFLFDLLRSIDIDTKKFYFTIPAGDALFKEALFTNGIGKDRIFELSGNDIYWTTWRFGKESIIGQGITAIYSRRDANILSAEEMLNEEDIYIPLFNIIYIDRKEENGKIEKINHPGFDIAVGIERLAAIMQNCDHYQTDIIKKNFNRRIFFKDKNIDITKSEIKIVTDHLRTAGIIISEGIIPHKNRQGYVLRK